MISPQHVDYIRFQTGRGVSREEITNSLRLNGVTDEDIQDGFAQMIANPSVMTVSGAVPAQTVQTQAPLTPQAVSSLWAKGIPWTNRIFMLASLGLFLLIDTPMLIETLNNGTSMMGDALTFFYGIMAATLVVFIVFYIFENRAFSKRFTNSRSSLDWWILVIIVIRNVAFILSFIPFIQILGMAMISLLGVPLLVAYVALIGVRHKKLKT